MNIIVLVAAEKGGTGKSTTVSNIAVHPVRQDVDVVLVNTDSQATCTWFSERRDEVGIGLAVPCIRRTGDAATTLHDLSRRYQVIVVDASGRDSRETRLAMAVSNLLSVPARASQADLETPPKVNELVNLARGLNSDLKVFAMLPMAPSNPAIRGADDVRETLSQFDQLELTNAIIHDRRAHRDTLLDGNGVVEPSNSQAYAEIQLLTREFFEVTAQA